MPASGRGRRQQTVDILPGLLDKRTPYAKRPVVPAIVERETGAVLMIVDDRTEAETISLELLRAGVRADVVNLPTRLTREASTD
jgi:hypothetical protein